MFLHVEKAEYQDSFKIFLKFNDGKEGVIDLEEELNGPIFQPLKNQHYFQNFSLKLHTISWPNGADFAPEFLYSHTT